MNQIIGGFFGVLAKITEVFFDIIIGVSQFLTNISRAISQMLLGIIMLACSVIFFLPLFLFALPIEAWIFIILVVLIGLLGNIAVSKLRYYKYIATEYLYDTRDYYKSDKKKKPFRDYQKQYEDLKRETARRRHEEERREFEEEMRKRQEAYREAFRDFGGFGSYWENPGSSGYGYGQNSRGQATSYGFKAQYEKAMDTLGLDYGADEYEIKLAYRKLAKKYHPDLNPDTDTTVKFQEINSAYEFLTEENIKKYSSL